MDLQKATEIIQATINGERHAHYDHTVAMAKASTSLVTTEGQDEQLQQVRGRESVDLKKQRVKLTNSYTGLALGQCKSFAQRSRRLPSIREVIEHADDKSKAKMKDIASRYKDNYSLFDWLYKELLDYNFSDPNAVFTVNFRNKSGELDGIDSFPVVYPSAQVLNIGLVNCELDWIVVEQISEVTSRIETGNNISEEVKRLARVGQKALKNYIFFYNDLQLEYKEIDKDDKKYEVIGQKIEVINGSNVRYFDALVHTPGNKKIKNFFFAGVIRDETKNKETFVPFWKTAENILKDLIRDKSFLDITKALHTFPQKFVYAETCDYEDIDEGDSCERGFLGGRIESTCPSCHGSGHRFHTTEQEVVAVKFPEGDGALPALSNYSHYATVPIDIAKFLDEQIDKHLRRVPLAVFGIETHEIATGVTATEVNEMSYVANDSLRDFCNKVSASWMTFVGATGEFALSNPDDLIFMHSFPKEVMNRTITELYALFDLAGKASAVVQGGVLEEIIHKQFANEPTVAARIITFNKHKPFRNLTENQLAFVLSSRPISDLERVKFENWSKITTGIWEEKGEIFLKSGYASREKMINDEAAKYVPVLDVAPVTVIIEDE